MSGPERSRGKFCHDVPGSELLELGALARPAPYPTALSPLLPNPNPGFQLQVTIVNRQLNHAPTSTCSLDSFLSRGLNSPCSSLRSIDPNACGRPLLCVDEFCLDPLTRSELRCLSTLETFPTLLRLPLPPLLPGQDASDCQKLQQAPIWLDGWPPIQLTRMCSQTLRRRRKTRVRFCRYVLVATSTTCATKWIGDVCLTRFTNTDTRNRSLQPQSNDDGEPSNGALG